MTDRSDSTELADIRRELVTIRILATDAVNAMRQAEAEIPEKMRRFANYWHDLVHIRGEYASLGLPPPSWIDREMERCHDRMKQLLYDLHSDGGHFEKVRREMTDHPSGPTRYDHTPQLAAPTKE